MYLKNTIDKSAISVGIICALPHELGAICAMLDHEYAQINEHDPLDSNSYVAGRIAHHDVVAACLPSGEYGTAVAAAVAKHMVRSFPQIKIGVMVGVGGGIPSEYHDIRLGDVAVSRPEGTVGGVIQYDLGRELERGKDGEERFERVGQLDKAPPALRSAVNKLEATLMIPGRSRMLPQLIQGVMEHPKKDGRWLRPSSDRLFHSDALHQGNAGNCNGCDMSKEVLRLPRQHQDPVVHYGTIATGNRVIKNAQTRDRLGKDLGAICCEMEAAGIMTSFPGLIVRGICDYADSHKNMDWQPFAALTAAAYTKELLHHVPSQALRDMRTAYDTCGKELRDDIASVAREVNAIGQQISKGHGEELEQNRSKLTQLFNTSTYREFKDVTATRVGDSCRWVLDDPLFVKWRGASHNDLLWITADAGCGKTVLAHSLIDEQLVLKPGTDAFICYFFFRDSASQTSIATALCAILHQLFSRYPTLLRHAQAIVKDNPDVVVKEPAKLWDIWKSICADQERPNIYCIFDALDECAEIHRFVGLLAEIVQPPTGVNPLSRRWTKVLVTSRPYRSLERSFTQLSKVLEIRLRGERKTVDINKEIDSVIRAEVRQLCEQYELGVEREAAIRNRLLGMENRTYLWLGLATAEIERAIAADGSLDDLDVIPSSVTDGYEKILSRIHQRNRSRARNVLRIIIAARRPFSLYEMHMAILLLEGNDTLTLDGLRERIRTDDAHFALNLSDLCGRFVFIQDDQCFLLHQTVKEFLIRDDYSRAFMMNDGVQSLPWKRSISVMEANIVMTDVFVRLLSLPDLFPVLQSCLPEQIQYDRNEPDPVELFEYITDRRLQELCREARLEWLHFIQQCQDLCPEPILSKLYVLHAHSPMQTIRFIHAHERPLIDQNECFEDSKMIRTGLVAMHGLHSLLRLFLGDQRGYGPSIVDFRDGGGDGLLQWAARPAGRAQIRSTACLEMLLSHGFSVGARGSNQEGILHHACRTSDARMIEFLLKRGADVQAVSGLGRTPLLDYAGWDTRFWQWRRHERALVMDVLKKYDADFEATDQYGANILRYLLDEQRGHLGTGNHPSELIEKAVRYGANPFTKDNAGCSAWDIICKDVAPSHGLSLVRAILNHGPSLSTANMLKGMGHFVVLAAEDDLTKEKYFARLLKRWHKHTEADSTPLTVALIAAANLGQLGIVDLLLKYVADVNAPMNGRSALMAAVQHSSPDVVRRLCKGGAHVNATYYGSMGSAMHIAAAHGDIEMLEILKTEGGDVNLTAIDKGSVLAQALCGLRPRSGTTWLVGNGAIISRDPTAKGREAYLAAQSGDVSRLDLCLSLGADVNTPGGRLGSPLHVAAYCGHVDMVRKLIDMRANVNALGPLGTPIYCAALPGKRIIGTKRRETFEALTSAGADTNIGSTGGSPIHLLFKDVELGEEQQLDLLDLLLRFGANPNASSPWGTPLCVAAGADQGSRGMARLLDAGADVDRMGPRGSALHAAAQAFRFANVVTLGKAGADINLPCKIGTPIQVALLPNCVLDRMLDDPFTYLEEDSMGRPCSNCVRWTWYRDSDYCTFDKSARAPGDPHVCSRWSQRQIRQETVLPYTEGAAPIARKIHAPDVLPWRKGNDERYRDRVETVRALLNHGADIHAGGPQGSARDIAGKWDDCELKSMIMEHGKTPRRGSERATLAFLLGDDDD
ncbi:Palmitoyltransferase akr1 [Sphaceloma murrayae]|uniref:Palmitoyltransferase akr1 n=1 Tax=Sphaceloma murrayae TaxID=2082308 RepID=A0A2K1QSP1_9PEZI|nr:Palmitoyltransferase akr1 [Sphaceloma murrayae]